MDALYEEDVASKGGGGVTNPVAVWRDNIGRKFQFFLDKSTPHPVARWVGSLVVAAIFGLRAYYVNGFYIVTYGLGIYLLNLLIGFLSPQVDPEIEDPGLPSKETDEFKPFIRRLPEFKFWYVSKYLCILYSANFSVTLNPNLFCIPIPTSQFPLLFYNVSLEDDNSFWAAAPTQDLFVFHSPCPGNQKVMNCSSETLICRAW
jgi:hypothetical protein